MRYPPSERREPVGYLPSDRHFIVRQTPALQADARESSFVTGGCHDEAENGAVAYAVFYMHVPGGGGDARSRGNWKVGTR
jgi:hypothetical protein